MKPKADKVYIVGSGPSGVAAARALLGRNRRVCMLDAGVTMEPERKLEIETLVKAGDIESCRAMMRDRTLLQCPPSNFHRKLACGSDFPYRRADAFIGCEPGSHEIHSSFALGGLSNVWGASALPFAGEDIADWPVSKPEMEPHYRAVCSFMRIAGSVDSLARHFPFFGEPATPFEMSPEAKALLDALTARAPQLDKLGIHVGRSRVALSPTYPTAGPYFPELYIYGLASGATFNAADVVADMKKNPNFEYVPGVAVTGFQEEDARVVLSAVRTETGEKIRFEGARVFLAAGVMPTARIVLSSLGAHGRSITLRQSLHFYFPFLHLFPNQNGGGKGASSLAEIFLVMRQPDNAGHWVFLLLNRFSEFFLERLAERSRPAAAIVRALQASPFINFFLCQGYLHSAVSPAMKLEVVQSVAGTTDVLRLTPESHRNAAKTVRRIVGHLASGTWKCGAFPTSAALDTGMPGRGNHVGGTFPMRRSPGRLECDPLGRPKGLQRIHLVDASVLPSIPATTITLGVMANAHRIATIACDL